MHASSEIRAAIQELAGFFTHDDLTAASSRCQVNESFSAARGRLEGLLRNQESLTPDETTEMMTMLVILSVNDVSEAYVYIYVYVSCLLMLFRTLTFCRLSSLIAEQKNRLCLDGSRATNSANSS